MERMALAAALLVLVGCDGRPDTFGQNYDACILQNAVKGGDVDSRAVATSICKRHFIKVWPKGKAYPTVVITTLGPAYDNYGAPIEGDTMMVTVRNDDPMTTITKLHVSAIFMKQAPNQPKGIAVPTMVDWDYDIDVEPNDAQAFTLLFNGDKAPSHDFTAVVEPLEVLPHGNPRR
ncbi:hypothetical protein [Caulobacter sp.]|uniref:hypothetical protein n=1 Tax=Caulobacter sp. TaxID=78 RepID=UPI003BB0B7C6